VVAIAGLGRWIVRPPLTFGIVAFGAIASALLVGIPLGIVVGAMTDLLDRWSHGLWPAAAAGAVIAGLLGTTGAALGLISAFVHPSRGAVWDHLYHR
jgi:hypothetical protein